MIKARSLDLLTGWVMQPSMRCDYRRNLRTFSPQTLDSHCHVHVAQEEMVHAIVVNEGRKRITVMFRGSVTQKDFVQDAKCAQKKIDMPIAALRDDVDSIRIHTGFHGETTTQYNIGIIMIIRNSLTLYPPCRFTQGTYFMLTRKLE